MDNLSTNYMSSSPCNIIRKASHFNKLGNQSSKFNMQAQSSQSQENSSQRIPNQSSEHLIKKNSQTKIESEQQLNDDQNSSDKGS